MSTKLSRVDNIDPALLEALRTEAFMRALAILLAPDETENKTASPGNFGEEQGEAAEQPAPFEGLDM